jgi:hypothetical protein
MVAILSVNDDHTGLSSIIEVSLAIPQLAEVPNAVPFACQVGSRIGAGSDTIRGVVEVFKEHP